MKTIWKYNFEPDDQIEIEMPENAKVLDVQCQHNHATLWALVDPNVNKEKRIFRLFETGHPINQNGLTYIASFQMLDGRLVFHIFE